MPSEALELPGLLRTWRRQVAGLSQAKVVADLSITKPALSMWENGRRTPDLASLEALDLAYGAEGALVDLALALNTPDALPARTTWAHSPQGPSTPRWAWLRPRPGRSSIEARLLWGAFAFDCSGPCSPHGLFVTSPISMPNPPVWVHLKEAAWVDFGRGEIPDGLGIPASNPLTAARVSRGAHSPVGLIAPAVVERFRGDERFAAAVVAFFGQRPELIRDVFSAQEVTRTLLDLTDGPRTGRDAADEDGDDDGGGEAGVRGGPGRGTGGFDAAEFRALRDARGLSRLDVARLATGLWPDEPVSEDQLRMFEAGGRPRIRHLPSRLDTIYRADGVSCRDRLAPRSSHGARSPFVFDVPPWWIGPIWVRFRAPGRKALGAARLEFGLHRKQLRVRAGTTVTCRRSIPEDEPLRVVCPGGWMVEAGVGWHPAARDANWGWQNEGDVASRGDADVHELFLNLFGRTGEEFAALVHDFDATHGRPG